MRIRPSQMFVLRLYRLLTSMVILESLNYLAFRRDNQIRLATTKGDP